MKTTKILALGFAAAVAAASATAMAGDAPKAWNKCKACHKLDKNGVGPALGGVFGRKAGTAEGYTKYKAMSGVDFMWDDEKMSAWIEDPKAFLKANKDMVGATSTAMNVKIKKEDDRKAIIEYLKAN